MAMHNDITRMIHESEYRDHKILIVERKMRGDDPFFYLYIQDKEGNECGGINHVYYGHMKKEDLKDISIALPKIKIGIDASIESHKKWQLEKEQKRKELNWTGQSFKRGDYVHFKGDDKYSPTDTYVWTYFGHMGLEFYVIEHEQGIDRSNWLAKYPFEDMDGFECVHSSQLNEGLKYIQINCSQDFQGETDQLELIKPFTE